MSWLIHWLVIALALLGIAYFVPGFRVSSIGVAIAAAAILGIINLVIRPILLVLTLPINILTLGLFTFVINALMLKLAAALVPGFAIIGFWPALLGALVLAVVNAFF